MSNKITDIQLSGQRVDLKYTGKDGIYDIIENFYAPNGNPNPDISIRVVIVRNRGSYQTSEIVSQVPGFDEDKFTTVTPPGEVERRFEVTVTPPYYRTGDFSNQYVRIYPRDIPLSNVYSGVRPEEPSKFDLNFNEFTVEATNISNVRSITLNDEVPVRHGGGRVKEDSGVLQYVFDKPSWIDRTLPAEYRWTITDKLDTVNPPVTVVVKMDPARQRDDDDDDGGGGGGGGDDVIGCMTVGDRNYNPGANIHSEQYCQGSEDGRETAESIENKIEDAFRNSIVNRLIEIQRSNAGGQYELTEQDRFLQYSIIDGSGNYSPILNWVRGGDLQQVNTEIDVLDSIVLKLESPIDTSVERLTTVDLLNTPYTPVDFNIDLSEQQIIPGLNYLQPNFKKEVQDLDINEFSEYESFDNITKYGNNTVQKNIIDYYLQRRQNNIRLNTNFTNFENFVKFGSAYERLTNFHYKIKQIELYTSQSNVIELSNPSSVELTKISEQIRNVKNSFDDYEYHLYTESGSIYSSYIVSSSEGIFAEWPKTTESEIVTNGDFSSTSDWNLTGAATSISVGYLNMYSNGIVTQSISLTEDTPYVLSFDLQTSQLPISITYNGVEIVKNKKHPIGKNTFEFIASNGDSSNDLIIRGDNIFTKTTRLDSISIKAKPSIKSSTDPTVITWYDNLLTVAQNYDNLNRDSLKNNTPEYIREDKDSEDYTLFIDMVGQLFDEIWLHTKELNNLYDWNNNIFNGLSQDLSLVLLNMYAENLDSGFSSTDISDYLLGITEDNTTIGSSLTKFNFDRQQKETQRRLLTNLPYLLKHKGTKRSIKALINSYGIPESTLFIQEYGSFQTPLGVKHEFQKDTYTYKLKFDDSSNSFIRLQDNTLNGTKAVELSTQWIASNSDETANILKMSDSVNSGSFTVSFLDDGTNNSSGKVVLTIESGSDSFELSSSLQPIYNSQFWNILVQQVSSGSYEIHTNYFNRIESRFVYQTIASGTIPTAVSGVLDDSFNSVDTLIFGNQSANDLSFVGYLDELRVWGTPISSDNFTEHTKFPYSIKLDNALDIPTKLKVRVDIEDEFRNTFVGSPGTIPNLVFDPLLPSTLESHNFNIDDYEGFIRRDFVISPNIGATKVGNNKVRYGLNQILRGNTLTPSNEAKTKIVTKLFTTIGQKLNIDYLDENQIRQNFQASRQLRDRERLDDITYPLPTFIGSGRISGGLPKEIVVSYVDGTLQINEGNLIEKRVLSEKYVYLGNESIQTVNDVNELTIGFSPTEILNQIIIQHFGDTDLVDEYGNPTEQYNDTYNQLSTLVENFFANISNNKKSKFFIDYIRNFDKSLFNNIKKFIPSKANLTTALFIEPHYLNRSKAPRIAKAQTSNQTPSGANITSTYSENQESNFLTETNDRSPIQTRTSVSDIERFLGELYTINLAENGQANAILSEDEVGQYLNQDTQVITVTSGFIEDIILYNPPNENMVVRIKNLNDEQFLFEFRKHDYTQLLSDIESQIFSLPLNERNLNNNEYIDLVRSYNSLFQLNNKVFLIKYPYSGVKPGVQATLEDLQHQIITEVINGDGTNEEYEFITGDGQVGVGNDSGDLSGGGTTDTSTDTSTRTVATSPDEAIKLTVF